MINIWRGIAQKLRRIILLHLGLVTFRFRYERTLKPLTPKTNIISLWRHQDNLNNPRKNPNSFFLCLGSVIIVFFFQIVWPTHLDIPEFILLPFETLRNFETSKLWNFEVLKFWNFEALKLWPFETLELWNQETFSISSKGIPSTTQHTDSPPCIRIMGPSPGIQLGDFGCCLVVQSFLLYFGVYIIPKWLINDSWSIAILFKWFLELPKFSLNLDP